jgi:menaquinone-9 beta-reductase
MNEEKLYDAVIIGGGLAGLSLSIQLAKAGCSVALLEKEQYPFHKVCGEYISLESHGFLKELGLPIDEMNLPVIKKLIVSSPSGNSIKANLDVGGIGISRYLIDHQLYKIAVESGVYVSEKTKAENISFTNSLFTVTTTNGNFKGKVCAGAFGKRSNLDVKWERDFIKRKSKLNNYIGVKYHIKSGFPADTIALHNFKDGYCGISKIEENKCCLCYMTTAQNLKNNNNSFSEMEKNILRKNPFLDTIFSEADFIYPSPITISQISFDKKSMTEDHVLMLGDAAGMITPLCGNGMSMALHSSKTGFTWIKKYLQEKITREELEKGYTNEWNKLFARRLRTGRAIQRLFGKEKTTELFIKVIKPFPFLIRKIIKGTHGKPF